MDVIAIRTTVYNTISGRLVIDGDNDWERTKSEIRYHNLDLHLGSGQTPEVISKVLLVLK